MTVPVMKFQMKLITPIALGGLTAIQGNQGAPGDTYNGVPGTGDAYLPPVGGSGTTGFLSGIYKVSKDISLKLPGSLGQKPNSESLSVVPGETAEFPLPDTQINALASEASVAAMSEKLPASLGAKVAAESVSFVPASDAVFPLPEAQIGNQATGAEYNPPTGGIGLLGYASGAYKLLKDIATGIGDSALDTLLEAIKDRLPATLGTQTASASVSVTPASDAVFPLPTSQLGEQGTGSSYDPPTGGTGLLGYASGIFKAVLTNATETTLAAIKDRLPASLVSGSLAATLKDASGNPVDFTGTAPVINTSSYPQGATPVVAFVSGANANITASLPGAAGKTTYLVGYMIDSLGATVGSIKNPTIAGLINGTTISTILPVATGTTTANARSAQSFNPHLPAYAANTAIDITCPALGAGNTSAMVFAWGYQL